MILAEVGESVYYAIDNCTCTPEKVEGRSSRLTAHDHLS